MDIYSITEARKKLGELVNQVKYQKKVIALGKRGQADVYLVACDLTEQDLLLTEMNAASESFQFLKDEPDLYSRHDLKKRYV